jgi:glycosyltransferase involved in cell wall biosynthesis
MAHEMSQFPPAGVEYSVVGSRPLPSFRVIRSPLKGYLRYYDAGEHDLIEAVLSPIYTNCPWIYSLDTFEAAVSFNLLGCPVPRFIRVAYIRHLLLKDNFKRLICWSQAARKSLHTYGGISDTDEQLLKKVIVIYPGIREVPDNLIRSHENGDAVTILFSGDFFRKGGVNVIDAFELAQKIYPSIRLRVCCDEKLDFNIGDSALRGAYLEKIRRNDGILFGRVSRDDLVQNILPKTDIYLLPTYVEAFGCAILEAMAFGIPVISTNQGAIPEMIEHDVSGFMIDTTKFECDRLFRGYLVKDIPIEFREHVTEWVFRYLCQLIESSDLRKKIGMAGLNVARTRFSFQTRNERMLTVYRDALQA